MLRLKAPITFTRRIFQSTPFAAPVSVAAGLSATEPIEEEHTPQYNPSHFYPIRLYEVLNNRYQVVAKLGWGTSSTVWLAQDLHQWRWLPRRYVTVKVSTNNYADKKSAETELHTTEHITRANPQHVGHDFVRTLLDSFKLCGPHGTHVCLVFHPLREPLWIFKQRFRNDVIPSDILKLIAQMVLQGLEYLHSECHIIHTDLKSDNILIALRDESLLDIIARDEFEHPLPQKVLEDRIIYLSRNGFGLQTKGIGRPVITDFGLAVRGDVPHLYYHTIQADDYRAPEVILTSGWSYSADIWNLGVLLWDLLEKDGGFGALSPGKMEYTSERHLTHMIALLGPPPERLLGQGRETTKYFDHDGAFRYPELIPENVSLVDSLSQIKDEDKISFLAFIMRMLRWQPEERSSAKDLLADPWLRANH
ncbi:protein kinase [Histoplasma capsulatum G186AR]|uniref:non-specific serine/threonine protein kinase n=1 Tax=Ajellomyces capsulatus TaxID=5037 RepID=A0A8H8D8Y0_AJECA|nr:protein kinase [Histoplasma capsulatum]QSS76335.1 protein kinase [Histoplasma capsulatum G186AR]